MSRFIHSLTSRITRLSLLSLGCISLISVPAWAKEVPSYPLRNSFADNFLIGAAINKSQLHKPENPELKIVAKHYNTITLENSLKWESVHPKPDTYKWNAADKFVAFGKKHQMHMLGHVLFWHSQTPTWVFHDNEGKRLSKELLLARMRQHVRALSNRYGESIHAWDVVNETILANGKLRDSPWTQILGPNS